MGPIILFLTTLIWGTAFLAQKFGAEQLGPSTITALRSVLGGSFLLICIFVRNRRRGAPSTALRRSIGAGVACGVPLFFAMLAQQIGIIYTQPGVSAFLTTNYVLFVPLIVAVLTRRRPTLSVVFCALVALMGTYLICVQGPLGRVGRGEWWTILCALLFAVQMVVVDRTARSCDVLVLSATQLLTCAVLGLPFMLLPNEAASLANLPHAIWPLIYLGVFSSGIAYTMQNYGQARTPASAAAVILSFESVFGALSGWLALGDTLSPLQLLGCGLVLAAVIYASLPAKTYSKP